MSLLKGRVEKDNIYNELAYVDISYALLYYANSGVIREEKKLSASITVLYLFMLYDTGVRRNKDSSPGLEKGD